MKGVVCLALNKQGYDKYIEKKSPKSPIVKDTILAFVFGGAICTIGQVIMNAYKLTEMSENHCAMATSATLIFLGALFTGLGLYDRLAKYAGAGTIVPITGFANSIVSAALEFKSEGFILGMSANMFKIAGPVLVFGISGSVIYGLILVLFGGGA